jgi:hypothetical protein
MSNVWLGALAGAALTVAAVALVRIVLHVFCVLNAFCA